MKNINILCLHEPTLGLMLTVVMVGTYLRYGKLSRLINMVPKTRMVISFIMTTEGASNFKVHPESEPITYSVNCYGELSTQ